MGGGEGAHCAERLISCLIASSQTPGRDKASRHKKENRLQTPQTRTREIKRKVESKGTRKTLDSDWQ